MKRELKNQGLVARKIAMDAVTVGVTMANLWLISSVSAPEWVVEEDGGIICFLGTKELKIMADQA